MDSNIDYQRRIGTDDTEHLANYRRRLVLEDSETLAQALILATTEETRILARREHIWAITEYYESVLQALRDTVKEQHQVIREVARS